MAMRVAKMPLDEKQKQELLKMIEEQNRAILMGRTSTKSRHKKTTYQKNKPSETQNDLNSGIKEPAKITYQENLIDFTEALKHSVKKRSDIRSKLKAEAKKTIDLNWKLTLTVIISLVSVMIIGILVGYIFAIINTAKY